MPPNDVTVVILHPGADPGAGPLTRSVADARAGLAARHRDGFLAAGAGSVRIVSDPVDAIPFGARLRTLLRDVGPDGGLVVLGSGAIPLANAADRRSYVVAAAAADPSVLANNRYSADVVAIARAHTSLADLPDMATDNALPRWLADVAGVPVADRRRSWRLGVDIDGPLDLVLLGTRWAGSLPGDVRARVDERLAAVREIVADPGSELLIAGRLSSDTLRWLEDGTASRTRALVEERGLRSGARPGQRQPATSLGLLLERDGPSSLAEHLARLGDAAVLDTRVLLAHRLGPDESGWPPPEDRFASDLLLHERIVDPWLRELTAAAAAASIPVLLGGHTLVGPGLRLAVGRNARRGADTGIAHPAARQGAHPTPGRPD